MNFIPTKRSRKPWIVHLSYSFQERLCHQVPVPLPKEVPRQVCSLVPRNVCVPVEVNVPFQVCGQSFVDVNHFFWLYYFSYNLYLENKNKKKWNIFSFLSKLFFQFNIISFLLSIHASFFTVCLWPKFVWFHYVEVFFTSFRTKIECPERSLIFYVVSISF